MGLPGIHPNSRALKHHLPDGIFLPSRSPKIKVSPLGDICWLSLGLLVNTAQRFPQGIIFGVHSELIILRTKGSLGKFGNWESNYIVKELWKVWGLKNHHHRNPPNLNIHWFIKQIPIQSLLCYSHHSRHRKGCCLSEACSHCGNQRSNILTQQHIIVGWIWWNKWESVQL